MAIQLEANYSKKLGLPGYSSHQFSVSLKCELNDLSQVQAETARLYSLLQTSVDRELKQTGFLPEKGPGQNGNGHHDQWNCSPKQKDLILRIVDENTLDKNQIEALAQERFGKGIKALNKLEASGLIDELIEKYPSKQSNPNQRFHAGRPR